MIGPQLALVFLCAFLFACTSNREHPLDEQDVATIDLSNIKVSEEPLKLSEFVGEKWLEYLNREGIPYHLRIRENFWVEDPRTGKEFKAFRAFNRLQLRQSMILPYIYYVNNQLCYLAAARLKNLEGSPNYKLSCHIIDRRKQLILIKRDGRLRHALES